MAIFKSDALTTKCNYCIANQMYDNGFLILFALTRFMKQQYVQSPKSDLHSLIARKQIIFRTQNYQTDKDKNNYR